MSPDTPEASSSLPPVPTSVGVPVTTLGRDPEYRFPDEWVAFREALERFREANWHELAAEMRKLTRHGARRGDVAWYSSIRPVATALSCAMNERGIETPFTRQYFVTKRQDTQAARDLSLDRQVIDLHWLSIWADDAKSRWAAVYGGRFSFLAASEYAASARKAAKKVMQLGLTRREEMELACLRSQSVRDRQAKISEIFASVETRLREAKKESAATWVSIEHGSAITKAALLAESRNPVELERLVGHFCRDVPTADIERYLNWVQERRFPWFPSGSHNKE